MHTHHESLMHQHAHTHTWIKKAPITLSLSTNLQLFWRPKHRNNKNNIAAPNKRLRNFRDAYMCTCIHTNACLYLCVWTSFYVFLLHGSLAINLHKVRATVSKHIQANGQMQSPMHVYTYIHTYVWMYALRVQICICTYINVNIFHSHFSGTQMHN